MPLAVGLVAPATVTWTTVSGVSSLVGVKWMAATLVVALPGPSETETLVTGCATSVSRSSTE